MGIEGFIIFYSTKVITWNNALSIKLICYFSISRFIIGPGSKIMDHGKWCTR